MGFAIIGALLAFLLVWIITIRRRLACLDENINNAMAQLGVQVSARTDALAALLKCTKGYAAYETQRMMETLLSGRSIITAKSTPEEVWKQERMISEALDAVDSIAEQYPQLKSNENYIKCLNAIDSYEKMICTSSLIYNDSVAKLNRELRKIPTVLCGSAWGFRQRDYLVTTNEAAENVVGILN